MEKFSRWADLTTGLNPFVPHKQRFHGQFAVRSLQYLAGTAACVVRLPLLAAVGLVLVATNVIVSVLGVIPFIGRLLKRLTEWLLCSLLMLVLGVFASEEPANTRRLGLITSKAKKSTRIAPRDVIVCNFTSFVEVLYLARRFSPVFVFVSEEGASKGFVHACGLLEAIYRSCAVPIALERSRPSKLEDVINYASGPVVIFPEGARSNGKSVLTFLPVLEQLPLKLRNGALVRVHVVAFRYEYKNFSPSQSTQGPWRHLFSLCFHAYHSMRVTVLHTSEWSLQDTPTKTAASKTATSAVTSAQVERMRGLLAAMLRTKTVDLSVKDFVSFKAYWDHVTAGGRKPASEFTDRKAPHEHAQWSKRK